MTAILDPKVTGPEYVCAFALYVDPLRVIPPVVPDTIVAPVTPADPPPIPLKTIAPDPSIVNVVKALVPPTIPPIVVAAVPALRVRA